jgi:hypothetical protein
MKRLLDWPSLWLNNRQLRVKLNRGPCQVTNMTLDLSQVYMSDVHHNGKTGLYIWFFNSFPPLLRLSKQSTQAVHILRNNSSYGLFQLVGSGMGKRPSRTRHWFFGCKGKNSSWNSKHLKIWKIKFWWIWAIFCMKNCLYISKSYFWS